MVNEKFRMGVGLLAVGCLVLFLFPVFLGYDLKKKAENQDVK